MTPPEPRAARPATGPRRRDRPPQGQGPSGPPFCSPIPQPPTATPQSARPIPQSLTTTLLAATPTPPAASPTPLAGQASPTAAGPAPPSAEHFPVVLAPVPELTLNSPSGVTEPWQRAGIAGGCIKPRMTAKVRSNQGRWPVAIPPEDSALVD